MITQFGSLFAGHVDLDNEGLDGTPANDRWLSDENLATVFPKSEAIAKLMDRTGPPELITEQLMEIQHKYPGLEVVNVGQPVGTPQAVILEQLERFAAQVMPAFK